MALHVKRADGSVAGFADDKLEHAKAYVRSIGGDIEADIEKVSETDKKTNKDASPGE